MPKGRPNQYYTHVLPRFAEIKEWLEIGASEKEICEQLGINPKVFCRYKNDFKELNDLVTNARRRPVQQIKAALMKRALGFYYTETTTVTSEKGVQTTTYNKYSLPDVSAATMLLKHWDKDDDGKAKWTSDPAILQIRQEELKLKEKSLDENIW